MSALHRYTEATYGPQRASGCVAVAERQEKEERATASAPPFLRGEQLIARLLNGQLTKATTALGNRDQLSPLAAMRRGLISASRSDTRAAWKSRNRCFRTLRLRTDQLRLARVATTTSHLGRHENSVGRSRRSTYSRRHSPRELCFAAPSYLQRNRRQSGTARTFCRGAGRC
jgi:hypothetical protein